MKASMMRTRAAINAFFESPIGRVVGVVCGWFRSPLHWYFTLIMWIGAYVVTHSADPRLDGVVSTRVAIACIIAGWCLNDMIAFIERLSRDEEIDPADSPISALRWLAADEPADDEAKEGGAA